MWLGTAELNQTKGERGNFNHAGPCSRKVRLETPRALFWRQQAGRLNEINSITLKDRRRQERRRRERREERRGEERARCFEGKVKHATVVRGALK